MTDPLASQKHILFLIPNYDGSNLDSPTGSPLSYIKLGSAESSTDLTTAAMRGDDLLAAAGVSTSTYGSFFVDDKRNTACASAADGNTVGFRHDTHYDEAHAESDDLDASISDPGTTYYRSDKSGSLTSDKTSTELSAQLVGDGNTVYGRGGWRDHTDGNRIVTVRGDRVDLVVGNYKRVVFGRVSGFDGQGSQVGPTAYESSGGQLFERTSADIAQHYAIERVSETDIDGNTYWKMVERATNADCVFRSSGNYTDHHNGPLRKTTIGADRSSATDNPEMDISHHLGAKDVEIDADKMTDTVDVDEYESFVVGGADSSQHQNYLALSVHRARGKALQDQFTFEEELYSKVSIDTNFFVGRFAFKGGAALLDDHVGGYRVSMGVRMNAHVGARVRFHFGTRCRWYAGPWFRQTTGASLIADLGLYTKGSIISFWKAPPSEHVAFLGELELTYTGNEADVMKTRAYAMFMES